MNKYLPLLISLAVGVVTWVGVGLWSGTTEAWDSPLYWSVGFPVMAVSVVFIAFIWPDKSWRWGVAIIAAQEIVGFVQAFPQVSLWPLSLIMLSILSLPLILIAQVASSLRKSN